jgi:ATP-dependent RNA helicase DeaD
MERTLGSKILWMKVPAVKSVMKAIRSRIVASAVASLPDEEIAPPLDAAIPDLPMEGETPVPAAQTGSDLTVNPLPGPNAADAATADAVSPFLSKVCRQLIERLGAERAVEALVTLSYGELLDPSRYGVVTEFSEESFRDTGRGRDEYRGRFVPGRGGGSWGDSRRGGTRPDHGGEHRFERGGFRQGPRSSAQGSGAYGGGPGGPNGPRSPGGFHGSGPHSGGHAGGGAGRGGFAGGGAEGASRVYVGLGRRHGATARDVAELLIKAGAVPGRLVDAIEMKEFCAFATLPEEAARRACSFSRGAPGNPVIRPASPIQG